MTEREQTEAEREDLGQALGFIAWFFGCALLGILLLLAGAWLFGG